VQRQQPPAGVEVPRVALGAEQDGARAQPSAIGRDLARTDAARRRPLVERDAPSLHRPREPARELRRLDRRAVRRVDTASCPRDPDAFVALARVEPAEVVLAVASPMRLRDERPCALDLRLVPDDRQPACLRVVAVDALGRRDAPDLVDGVEHRALERDRALPLRTAHPGLDARVVQRAPPAVASRGAEAGDLALDDRDAKARILRGEVVRGPEAREAGACDRDVDALLAFERRARHERLAELGEPEARRSHAGLGHLDPSLTTWNRTGRASEDDISAESPIVTWILERGAGTRCPRSPFDELAWSVR
jgi:hypothetical protein